MKPMHAFSSRYISTKTKRLGRMLEHAGPDTVVIVVSDHGFQFRPYGFYHYGLDSGGGTLAPLG